MRGLGSDRSHYELNEEIGEGEWGWLDEEEGRFFFNRRLPRHQDWVAEATFTNAHTNPLLIALRLFHAPLDEPVGGLSVEVIRSVRVTWLYDHAWGLLKECGIVREYFGEDLADEARRRPGRRGKADLFYAQLAARYVDAVPGGHPVRELAKTEFLSDSQIRNLIYAARQRGLLTKAEPGRPGGQLTDKARRLLDGAR